MGFFEHRGTSPVTVDDEPVYPAQIITHDTNPNPDVFVEVWPAGPAVTAVEEPPAPEPEKPSKARSVK